MGVMEVHSGKAALSHNRGLTSMTTKERTTRLMMVRERTHLDDHEGENDEAAG